jgi:hypothetical protein
MSDLQYDCVMARRRILDALEEAAYRGNEDPYVLNLMLRYPSTYLDEYAYDCLGRFLQVRRVESHFGELRVLFNRYVKNKDAIVQATLWGLETAQQAMGLTMLSLSPLMFQYDTSLSTGKRHHDDDDAPFLKQARKPPKP